MYKVILAWRGIQKYAGWGHQKIKSNNTFQKLNERRVRERK